CHFILPSLSFHPPLFVISSSPLCHFERREKSLPTSSFSQTTHNNYHPANSLRSLSAFGMTRRNFGMDKKEIRDDKKEFRDDRKKSGRQEELPG
ncbi:MAG: hypothetical protein JZU65_16690, partial [Chlorobium sp.]|nr:hypothetical protein [Chlorobium sp.]